MSTLRNKLKKLSFFTHYPKEHESITYNNAIEEYPSKKETWNEWFGSYYVNGKWYLNAPVTILKFTGTNFTDNSSSNADFSNSVIDWGDGIINSPTRATHTYTDNTEHTIKIINAPYSSIYCFRSFLFSSILIPNITNLGKYCFYDCDNLKNIHIPPTVTSIGTYAFRNCDNLKSIYLPSSVTSIGSSCFAYSTNLTEIKLNWTTSNQILTYNNNWIIHSSSNLKFIIPQGTTSLYTAKGYPSDKLQEATS